MPFKPAEDVQSAFETRSFASHGKGKVFWRLPAVGASETLSSSVAGLINIYTPRIRILETCALGEIQNTGRLGTDRPTPGKISVKLTQTCSQVSTTHKIFLETLCSKTTALGGALTHRMHSLRTGPCVQTLIKSRLFLNFRYLQVQSELLSGVSTVRGLFFPLSLYLLSLSIAGNRQAH